MHLLGYHLPDHKLVKIALTKFYGISHHTSSRILARLQIHDTALVSSLTEPQITALSAYLSSPATTPAPEPTPICPPGTPLASWNPEETIAQSKGKAREDPLNELKIETDLRRSLQADIAHHREIGTYRGRRHAAHLPVRGQNTRNNAKTAKRLNRVDRRGFASSSAPSTTSSIPIPSPWTNHLNMAGPNWVEKLRGHVSGRF